MDNEELKELKAIKKLLALIALRSGWATSEDVDAATGMGAGNIRAMFPAKKRERKESEPLAVIA